MKQNNIYSNEFLDKLNFYQSANSDDASIKKNFVIRLHEFDTIIDALKNKKNNDSLQHELILGQRGSGKSTLLKRIEIEIKESKVLAKKYIAINFAEEQASIYQLHDLWFETLKELENKFNLTLDLKEFSTFKKPQDYTRYLFNEINKILKKEKRKVVLLIDNFDRILENFKENDKLLRDFLINYNNIQIIGGSTRINEHFWRYDKPFYDFFRQHVLKSLTFNEINDLLNSWSSIMNQPKLKDYAINNKGKIESIRILTDGMPRTLQFFIRILLTNKEVYGFQYIKKIMDKATPLYQEKLNSLTPAQRKIVSEMAFIWEPTTTKELVNKCKMESKLVSSYLKQLDGLGVVKTLDTNKRNKKYSIEERFFNMWLIVTQGNPEQKRKAKYLTVFLENWYDENEIKEIAQEHLNLVKEGTISYEKASVKTKALSQSRFINLGMRDLLIFNTNQINKNILINNLPNLGREIIKEYQNLMKQEKYDLALKKVNEIENEEDGIKFALLGNIFKAKKQFIKAEEFYLKNIYTDLTVLAKNNPYFEFANQFYAIAVISLADIYNNQFQDEKIEKLYLSVIKKGIIEGHFSLALFYFRKNKNPQKSLELVTNISDEENSIFKIIQIIINVWNGVFTEINNKINLILDKNEDTKQIENLFRILLYLQQKNLVLSYFESEKYGAELKEKYILLYYATLILTNKIESVQLNIPKEVIPAVNHIVQQIKEQNEFYSNPPSN